MRGESFRNNIREFVELVKFRRNFEDSITLKLEFEVNN